MTTLAITGSEGVVGKALIPRLAESYDILPLDLPDNDVLDTNRLTKQLKAADVVLHLAGVYGSVTKGRENWLWDFQDPRNKVIFGSVLHASTDANVQQFIHASSVHTEDVLAAMHSGHRLDAKPRTFATAARSGYGRGKREEEEILEDEAYHFPMGAVSLRIGGVTPTNLPLAWHRNPDILQQERSVWLEHGDLADLVGKIIEHPQPFGYDVVNAVSDNDTRIHTVANNVGWHPVGNSAR